MTKNIASYINLTLDIQRNTKTKIQMVCFLFCFHNFLILFHFFRHCVVAHTEPGVVTVTPSHPEAETYVNQHRITETTFLTHGCAVRFGRNHVFRFLDPPQDLRSTSSVTLPPPASSSEQGGQVPEGNYAYFPPGGRPVNGYPRPGKK